MWMWMRMWMPSPHPITVCLLCWECYQCPFQFAEPIKGHASIAPTSTPMPPCARVTRGTSDIVWTRSPRPGPLPVLAGAAPSWPPHLSSESSSFL